MIVHPGHAKPTPAMAGLGRYERASRRPRLQLLESPGHGLQGGEHCAQLRIKVDLLFSSSRVAVLFARTLTYSSLAPRQEDSCSRRVQKAGRLMSITHDKVVECGDSTFSTPNPKHLLAAFRDYTCYGEYFLKCSTQESLIETPAW